jgi:hypothetical protein
MTIEILYLENLYNISAGIHSMGHFGKTMLQLEDNFDWPNPHYLNFVSVHTTNRRYDLPKREYGDFTCFITMK